MNNIPYLKIEVESEIFDIFKLSYFERIGYKFVLLVLNSVIVIHAV